MPKKCQELEQELKALKARIRELSAAPQAGEASSAEAPPVEAAAHVKAAAKEVASHLPLDFDELTEVLKREVEGMNPLTCLAIFGLGVLTGRLLAP